MARSTSQQSVWKLVGRQHGVIEFSQLRALGYSAEAIQHRIETGRLHQIYRGVYAVGRREVGPLGEWMAAVLAYKVHVALSDDSAAELWELTARAPTTPIQLSSLVDCRSRDGIKVHQRKELATTTHKNIPVTTPAQTLIDLARKWTLKRLEAAINEADKRDLIHPKALHEAAKAAGKSGAALRRILDRQTLVLADTDLERYFLRIVRKARLPLPDTQAKFGRYRVDFHWPDLDLVVETDGGRYHRTAAQQTKDRKLEHLLAKREITIVRFTHAQVVYEAGYVAETLADVIRRRPSPGAPAPRARSGRGRRPALAARRRPLRSSGGP